MWVSSHTHFVLPPLIFRWANSAPPLGRIPKRNTDMYNVHVHNDCCTFIHIHTRTYTTTYMSLPYLQIDTSGDYCCICYWCSDLFSAAPLWWRRAMWCGWGACPTRPPWRKWLHFSPDSTLYRKHSVPVTHVGVHFPQWPCASVLMNLLVCCGHKRFGCISLSHEVQRNVITCTIIILFF